MPKISFLPQNIGVDFPAGTKLLLAAIKANIPLRFGCSVASCGLCGVLVRGSGALSPMESLESELLKRLQLPLDGTVRLACQAKIMAGLVIVDLEFQKSYDPSAFKS